MLYPYDNTKVTVELRDLVNSGVDIWNFDYPSYYKGTEKTAFEHKVIEHYYFRQIGQETPARFMHYFRTRINEIMPYYIQLYKSAELMNDPSIKPLDNYSMVEEYEETNENSGTSTGKTSSVGTVTEESDEIRDGNKTIESESEESGNSLKTIQSSDTPQSNIPRPSDERHYLTGASREDGNHSISDTKSETEDYRDDISIDKTVTNSDEVDTISEGTSESKTTHRLTRSGNIGVTTYAQMLQGLRDTFLNIDMMIINELNDLFLGVY